MEPEVGSLKATIDKQFNIVQQQFSSLEAMLLKLTELHLKPPPGMAGEGSGGTETVVGGGAKGEGPKTTSLARQGATGHDGFGGEEVSPGDSQPRGAFLGVRPDRGS